MFVNSKIIDITDQSIFLLIKFRLDQHHRVRLVSCLSNRYNNSNHNAFNDNDSATNATEIINKDYDSDNEDNNIHDNNNSPIIDDNEDI